MAATATALASMPTTTADLSGTNCTSYTNYYDMFLGTTPQPDVLVNLCSDPAAAQQAIMLSSMAGTTGPASYQGMTGDDVGGGYSTRNNAPLYVPDPIDAQIQTASAMLPSNILDAAVSQSTFGFGTFNTFKADKPPQGVDAGLRPTIPIPIANTDFTNAGFIPTTGPFNQTSFNRFAIGYDPRYSAPVYAEAASTYKYPTVPMDSPPDFGASGGAPTASTLLSY